MANFRRRQTLKKELTKVLLAEVLGRLEERKVRQDGGTDDGRNGRQAEPASLVLGVSGSGHYGLLVVSGLLLIDDVAVGDGDGAQQEEEKKAFGVHFGLVAAAWLRRLRAEGCLQVS